ncbi:hypothetical protein K458DRAFT_490596 [Lentithecium fluviatile CBS 122367]|uniref:Uncharacterized protein n=1 Tax=Lentithecium fluviatile CBS 122367 TaxID=1168545 RepID=A0A6G1INI6_9PLEO|nr:hypothetical protein K458DRAFT_490596 [Lentithecium fluviatile CBS 122367]
MAWTRESIIALLALLETCAPIVVLLVKRKSQARRLPVTYQCLLHAPESNKSPLTQTSGDVDIERASQSMTSSPDARTNHDEGHSCPSTSAAWQQHFQWNSHHAHALCAQLSI